MQTSETIASLQSHITHLTNLVERVNTLRKVPGLLLAPSTLTGSQLEQGFSQINDLKLVVAGNTTQECLKHAQESFSKNSGDVSLDGRRQSRKRRRPPSPLPDSPRLPPVLPEQIFPPTSHFSPLTLSGLPSYIREHNRSELSLKLHIWTPTKPKSRINAPMLEYQNPTQSVVRISIKDVLYAYVRLGAASTTGRRQVNPDLNRMQECLQEDRLVIETVTIFGPRERKSPHSQSDFMVFQKISQYITWMIQTEPDVELQSLVALFKSYESFFVAQCTVCHRVLSEEGHFPPVCRIWTPHRKGRDATSAVDRDSGVSVDDNTDGRWEPCHRACLSRIRQG